MELYVRKSGRARIVIVPNVVMHFLKMPLVSAGLKVERDDRGRKQIIATALCSIKIRRSISDSHVDHAQLGIDRRLRARRGRRHISTNHLPTFPNRARPERALTKIPRLLCPFLRRTRRNVREHRFRLLTHPYKPGRRSKRRAPRSCRDLQLSQSIPIHPFPDRVQSACFHRPTRRLCLRQPPRRDSWSRHSVIDTSSVLLPSQHRSPLRRRCQSGYTLHPSRRPAWPPCSRLPIGRWYAPSTRRLSAKCLRE